MFQILLLELGWETPPGSDAPISLLDDFPGLEDGEMGEMGEMGEIDEALWLELAFLHVCRKYVRTDSVFGLSSRISVNQNPVTLSTLPSLQKATRIKSVGCRPLYCTPATTGVSGWW
jgi:hypothetical protein